MNLILDNTANGEYPSSLRCVLEALGASAVDYDWFISDIETNLPTELCDRAGWVSGEVLCKLLAGPDLQFTWAVLSAVPKGYRAEVQNVPFADGNSQYWEESALVPQLLVRDRLLGR